MSRYSYQLYILYHDESQKSCKLVKCLKYEDSKHVILNKYDIQILHIFSEKVNINKGVSHSLLMKKGEMTPDQQMH